MSIFEAAMRGGATTTLLLLALLLLRDAGRSPAARSCALFLVSAAGYAVYSAPSFGGLGLPLGLPLLTVSLGVPALFWMATAAIFDDAFKPSWHRGLAWLGLVTLGLWSIVADEPRVALVYYTLSLLFVGLGAWHALAGRESDLIETRRRLRVLVAVSTALYAAAMIVANTVWPGTSVSAAFSIFNAIGLMAMAFAAAMAWLGIARRAPSSPANSGPRSPSGVDLVGYHAHAPQPGDDQESALLVRLRRLMDEQKLYRQDRLSIAVLAGKLGIPEYRLRRLINRRLGHRNFSSFVNSYRLAEARAALADPRQARVPILTIALDTGFQSLAPFNRSFKTMAGMTPSQYRRQYLSRPDPSCAT